MSFPKRDEYSYWYNETPITDLHEALYFLAREGSSRNPYCLAKPRGYWGQNEVPDRWELHAPWYREGSSGGDTSGTDYYQIDPALAEQLINEGYVAPRRVKQWGHTEERKDELVITEKGRCVDEAFEKQMLKKAESMLVPGIHTDLTETRNAASTIAINSVTVGSMLNSVRRTKVVVGFILNRKRSFSLILLPKWDKTNRPRKCAGGFLTKKNLRHSRRVRLKATHRQNELAQTLRFPQTCTKKYERPGIWAFDVQNEGISTYALPASAGKYKATGPEAGGRLLLTERGI